MSREASDLVKEFIDGSRDFFRDDVDYVMDSKHAPVIKAANEIFSKSQRHDMDKLREWAMHGDMGPSVQMNWRAPARTLYALFQRLFNWDPYNRNSLLDDFAVIDAAGALPLLKENPVHESPGGLRAYRHAGYSFNQRWLRYIYLAHRMQTCGLIQSNDLWVDIGPFYGGLCGLVRKSFPKVRCVLVDFNHQLCRSYVYLSLLGGNARHILPDEAAQWGDLSELPEGSIMYLPAKQFPRIANQSVDLVSSFVCLGEMQRSVFEGYMSSPLMSTSKKLYLVNRFVSSPFFERTYDNDLNVFDYRLTERDIEYFDIFPLQHYQLIRREVWGRKVPRNLSSSFFEAIAANRRD